MILKVCLYMHYGHRPCAPFAIPMHPHVEEQVPRSALLTWCAITFECAGRAWAVCAPHSHTLAQGAVLVCLLRRYQVLDAWLRKGLGSVHTLCTYADPGCPLCALCRGKRPGCPALVPRYVLYVCVCIPVCAWDEAYAKTWVHRGCPNAGEPA